MAETTPTTIRNAEGLTLWLGDQNESLPVDVADHGPQESIAEWMAGFPADEMADAEIVGSAKTWAEVIAGIDVRQDDGYCLVRSEAGEWLLWAELIEDDI